MRVSSCGRTCKSSSLVGYDGVAGRGAGAGGRDKSGTEDVNRCTASTKSQGLNDSLRPYSRVSSAGDQRRGMKSATPCAPATTCAMTKRQWETNNPLAPKSLGCPWPGAPLQVNKGARQGQPHQPANPLWHSWVREDATDTTRPTRQNPWPKT